MSFAFLHAQCASMNSANPSYIFPLILIRGAPMVVVAAETLLLSTASVSISPRNNYLQFSEKHGLQCYGSEQYHGFQINLFYEATPTLRLKPVH